MEFLETFQKVDDQIKKLQFVNSKSKIIFICIVIYTLAISFLSCLGTVLLLGFINLTNDQKMIASLLIVGITYTLFSKVDWKFLKTIYQTLKKSVELIQTASGSSGDTDILLSMSKRFFSGNKSNSSEYKKVEEIGDTLLIFYHHRGKEHKIHIPYDKKNVNLFTGYKVFAEYTKDGKTEDVEITHQVGIHYLISPEHIGAQRIYSVDNEGNILNEVQGADKFFIKPKLMYDE